MNLRVNDSLCKTYVKEMAAMGEMIMLRQTRSFNASTDMGNVSHAVPSFHGAFCIPTDSDVASHNPKFAAAAGTDDAHAAAIKCAKGLAMLAVRVMVEDEVAAMARKDFQREDEM